MCKTDNNMEEVEYSDAIGLNIALELSKNHRKKFLPPKK